MIAEQLWQSLVIFQSPPHQESIRGNSMLQPSKRKKQKQNDKDTYTLEKIFVLCPGN
jgi:hypothetical protein